MKVTEYIPYAVTVISIIGTLANAYKKRWCFFVWAFTNTYWCIYDIYIGAYSQAILYAVYLAICAKGLIEWRETK